MLVWARGLGILAAACSWVGCGSLFNLGDFGLESCTEMPGESACEILNRERGVPDDACLRYQCRRDGPGCELRPKDSDDDGEADARVCEGIVDDPLDCDDDNDERQTLAPETCDEVDNDCDWKIDESLPMLPAANTLYFETGTELRFLEAAQFDEGDLYVLAGETQARGSALHLLVFAQGELAPRESRSYDIAVTLADRSDVFGQGACVKFRDGEARGNECGFEEVALSVVDGKMITAAVDTMSSALGVLRVGVLASLQSSFQIRLGSSAQQQSLALAIQEAASGVQSPRAVAGAPGEALLVWQTLGQRADGAACPRRVGATCDEVERCGETELFVLGVWGRTASNGLLALDVASDVSARRIGSTSVVPPAVTRFRLPNHEGYLVAYAGFEAVELYSRGWFAADPEPMRGTVAAAGRVTEIAFAQAKVDSEEGVGPTAVAWRTGCGANASVRLARLELDSDSRTWTASPNVTVHSDANVVAGPWIEYASTGFRVARSDGLPEGGWLVAWIEQNSPGDRVLAFRRVAEANLQPMGESQQLARGSIETAFSFTSATGAIGYGYVEVTRDRRTSLRTGEAVCNPSR